MASQHTHYDNLKVARNAPPEVIRAAYKSLAQKYHPDKHHDPIESERIIKIINAAYEVLMNPEARAKYDIELGREETKNVVTPPSATTSSIAKYSPTQTENINTHSFKTGNPFITSRKVILPMAIYGLIILCLAIFATMLIKANPTEQQKTTKPTEPTDQTTTLSSPSNLESLDGNRQQQSSAYISATSPPQTALPHALDQSPIAPSASTNAQIMRSDQADKQGKNTTYPTISYEHAEKLFQDNRFIEADLMVDALLTRSPNYAAAWRLKGMLQASRGNIEAATKAFSSYLQASNNSEEAITSLKNLSSGKNNVTVNIQQAARQALNNVGKE